MARPDQTLVINRLLRALTAKDYALLQPYLDAVMLEKGAMLIRPDELIEEAYFLSSSLGPVIISSNMVHSIEIGLVGREGMIGLPLLLSSERTPYSLSMQIGGAGSAKRMQLQRLAAQAVSTIRAYMHRPDRLYSTLQLRSLNQ